MSEMIYGNPEAVSMDEVSNSSSSSLAKIMNIKLTKKRYAQQLCEQILLRIDKKVPSRSILVQQLPTDLQAGAVKIIQNLLSEDKMEVKKLDEVLLTANYGRSYCYALVKDVYCFGNNYLNFIGLRQLHIPDGVKRLEMGYQALAVEDMNNNWTFIDPDRMLPSILTSNISYNFGEDLLDLKIYESLICYLNSEHELFCGGSDLNEIISTPYDNYSFLKMTDIKIKEFFLSTSCVFAVGLDGKIYNWQRRSRSSDLNEYLIPIDLTLAMYEFVFNQEVHNIFQMADNIVLNATNNKLYLFSEDVSNLRVTRRKYGISYSDLGFSIKQGKEISEGYKFVEVSHLIDAMCGVTLDKELYCRGILPSGLKYESKKDPIASSFTKVSNAPKNFKKVMFGESSICFLLESNQITCTSNIRVELRGVRDDQDRLVFRGNSPTSIYQAPHLIAPFGE